MSNITHKKGVNPVPLKQNPIKIGSRFKVQLCFDDDENLEYVLTLTDNPTASIAKGLLSLDSPLGKSVWQKTEGFSGDYSVNGEKTGFKILEVFS